MPGPTKNRPKLYLLPLSEAEKARLVRLADAAGVTMAQALREGAVDWLCERVAETRGDQSLAEALR